MNEEWELPNKKAKAGGDLLYCSNDNLGYLREAGQQELRAHCQ